VITQTHEEDSIEDIQEDNEEDACEAEFFEHWTQKLWTPIHGTRKPKLTQGRRKPVRARLREGFTLDQLKLVVDHVAVSEFMMGENDSGRAYIEPENFLRNRAKAEQWLAAKPRNGKGSVQRDPVPSDVLARARARGEQAMAGGGE
jgi:uncharacterized phage protein (TIGR02220 family)